MDHDAGAVARRLASAVLKQALHDAANARLDPAVRREARAFLSRESWARRFWCELAGVPTRACGRALSEPDEGSAVLAASDSLESGSHSDDR